MALDEVTLDRHVDACMRHRSSVYKMPWERGVTARRADPYVPVLRMKGPPPLMPLASPAVAAQGPADDAVLASVASTCGMRMASKLSRCAWDERLSAARQAAIKKWVAVLAEGGLDFEVVRSLLTSQRDGMHGGSMQSTLRHVFSMKATNTLSARVGPILRYMSHCKGIGHAPFPVKESVLYAYLSSIEASCAATYPRSLIASMAFCHHVLGSRSAGALLGSQRLIGLSSACYLRKRKTVQRPPLKAWHLKKLEAIAMGQEAKTLLDQVAAGFFVFLTFARARFSDGQAVQSMSLDLVKDAVPVEGFLEAAVTRSKTSFSLERKTKYLPLVAQVRGLSEGSWALGWLKALEKASVSKVQGMPLLPAPSSASGWAFTPISAEAASQWLRGLLRAGASLDADEEEYVSSLGTHSCKTTLLSWAAKAGTSLETRKIMGYRSLGRNQSAFVYGRDNISPALREIARLVEMVREGVFDPDTTRSGYFRQGLGLALDEEGLSEQEGVRDSSSSEDSADEEDSDRGAAEEAVERVVGEWHADLDPSILPQDPSLLYRHLVSRVLHVVDDEAGDAFACGRELSSSYGQLDVLPRFWDPVCRQCFGRFRRSGR